MQELFGIKFIRAERADNQEDYWFCYRLRSDGRASNFVRSDHASRRSPQRALLDKYCVTCHNDRAKTGGLTLEKIDVANIPANAETWEKVIRKLSVGAMPPSGMPKPSESDVSAFLSSLEASLDKAYAANPNPGHATLHRLNRTEYANSIRDLLSLDVDASTLLPPDDESYGFDNNADVLGVSPVLLERYVSASRKVSRLAIGDITQDAVAQTYRTRPDLSQDKRVEGLPLGTRGGLLMHYNFPLDGKYVIKIVLARNTVDVIRGLEEAHQIEILVDGARVFLASVGGTSDTEALVKNPAEARMMIEARLQARVPVKAGPRTVAVTFLQKNAAEDDYILEPFLRTTLDPVNEAGLPHIDQVVIAGPYNATGPGDTPSRRKIFVCRPANSSEEVGCAKKILTALARGAYRRPITPADTETLLSFYQAGRNKGGSFDAGIERALRLILSSPEFVFRFERDPSTVAAGASYRINDLELASRLSFFLWSSIPDDELLNLAAAGKLSDPATLDQPGTPHAGRSALPGAGHQFRRAMAVPAQPEELRARSERVSRFRRQPAPVAAHRNRDVLRKRRQRRSQRAGPAERQLHLRQRDGWRSTTASRTSMGRASAASTLTDEARRGLLGQGSVLTVTSYATRTSPVLRGKWILTNILGTPPPAPPPNVPALKENNEGGQDPVGSRAPGRASQEPGLRQLPQDYGSAGIRARELRRHRPVARQERRRRTHRRVGCAAGRFQSGWPDHPARRPDEPARCFRDHPDREADDLRSGPRRRLQRQPAIRAIVARAASDHYRFSDLVAGIVKSPPFRMKIKTAPDVASPPVKSRNAVIK